MYTGKTKVINPTGIHARPASEFVKKAKDYVASIKIENCSSPEDVVVNAKSILGVLRLAMVQGREVKITAEGEDEEAAVKGLIELIDSGFGE